MRVLYVSTDFGFCYWLKYLNLKAFINIGFSAIVMKWHMICFDYLVFLIVIWMQVSE